MASDLIIPRERRLRAWMLEHDITNRALAERLGVTPQRVGAMVRNDTMPTLLHAKCVSLGFPVELLPEAVDLSSGPKPRVPLFPALMNEAEAQQA